MTSFRVLVLRNAVVAALPVFLLLLWFLLREQEQLGRAALDRSLLAAVATLAQLGGTLPPDQLQEEVRRLDPALGLRLTVIRENGTVLADSEADPRTMENHGNRPEVQQALSEGIGSAERRSATLGRDMRYLAIASPGGSGGRRVFRAAAPLTRVRAQVQRTQAALLLGMAAVLLLSVLLFARMARRLAAPIDALSDAAFRFSAGERNVHVLPDGPDSLQRLGSTFNAMVDRLDTQLRRLDEAQAYLDAVIRQMPEGLLALDARGSITRVNAAAEALLGASADRLVGRPVLAALMSYALDREVTRVLEGSQTPGEEGGEIEVRTPDGRTLSVAVGPLVADRSTSGEGGAVVILKDISDLRRADSMRRDFVANVSHELRTPVAAIRAMVDTLALRGERRPELIQEYSPRIVAACERIDRLVRDLLLLAETESGHLRINLELLDPREIVEEIVRQVEPIASPSGTCLEIEEFPDAQIHADRFALGQCVRNLVDNAVRHAAGGKVRTGGRLDGNQVVLYVTDDGPGIPAEDLPRIFERFYRVDKARTREGGGSGLGLSIVRHLAEAQGARAWAESRPGEGSTFYLAFPYQA